MLGMKRTISCSLLDADPLSKKQAFGSPCSLQDEEEVINSSNSSLTSSEVISDETECETESSLSSSEELAKKCVRFSDSVAVRVVYCSSEDDPEETESDNNDKADKEESIDSVVGLKKEDNSRPTVETVHFDEDEEAIRSQLVGCICATRRKKHNYAAMYGCGKSISDDSDEESSEDDNDDFDEFKEPARVIVACDPSSAWFSF